MSGTGGRLTREPSLIGADDKVCPFAELLGVGREDERTTSEFNETTDPVIRRREAIPTIKGGHTMTIKNWTGVFLALSFLMSTPALASEDLEALIKAGDHRKLEMYYLDEAKNLKAKADKWEFIAEYYEKFPEEYSGGSESVHKHIQNLRAMADDYRKAMHEARDLASRHHSLMRKGP